MEENNKQTEVEWLIDELNNIKSSSTNMDGKIQFLEKEIENLFQQAKEREEIMEKVMTITVNNNGKKNISGFSESKIKHITQTNQWGYVIETILRDSIKK